MTGVALSFLAGTLASFSPCVLPALPLVAGSASQRHRFGPLALAAGMAFSFAVVGLTLSATGSLLGLSDTTFRTGAAVLLLACGIGMVSARARRGLEKSALPLANAAQSLIQNIAPAGLKGQFFIGSLLGAVWAPCTGPVLGAAMAMAAQAGARSTAALQMLVFGVGATVPLLVAAYGARWFLAKRQVLRGVSQRSRVLFGATLILFSLLNLSGGDVLLEAKILAILPEAVLRFITSL